MAAGPSRRAGCLSIIGAMILIWAYLNYLQ